MKNQFGKISRLQLVAESKEHQTVLGDVFFTAPYKIMTPFRKQNSGIQVMPLCASAGIMEGDHQEFSFLIKSDAELEMLSQSFDKIHKMEHGKATRTISATVEKNGTFYYYPQPVIPFGQSSFENVMKIDLEDMSSRYFMVEIISCGRVAHQERFSFHRFSSRVEIRRNHKLIYRDNTLYEPERMPMESLGMYEGYTHLANILLSSSGIPEKQDKLRDQIWALLEEEESESSLPFTGGVTSLMEGDLAVRLLGCRAQQLQGVCEKIKEFYQAMEL